MQFILLNDYFFLESVETKLSFAGKHASFNDFFFFFSGEALQVQDGIFSDRNPTQKH